MSKAVYKQRMAQLRWLQVLSEKKSSFGDAEGIYLMEKLKKVKFTKQGEIRQDKIGNMVLKEFPSLLFMWRMKQDETQI